MITLYKPGNTHDVQGILCELKQFDVNELDYALSHGYVTDPKDTIEKEPQTVLVKDVRAAAKAAGIPNYSKAPVEKLIRELNREI